MEKKKILFITGTRADYGKIKSLMIALNQSDDFELYIFVCGMHLSKKLGSTYDEIVKDGYENIYIAYGVNLSQSHCAVLGDTIRILSGYVETVNPDMIVVHGDRMEALVGAVVGAVNNIMVGHIEGGELSGTIDESIRHAVSKLAHVHFVCTNEAKQRLIQLGEERSRIYVIGSPDIDIMLSKELPSLEEAKERYEIPYDKYAIMMYHPVTTEYAEVGKHVKALVDAVMNSGMNYIVIYPNNDLGSEVILNELQRLDGKDRFCVFPSLRFEYFLSLLKNSEFIIGNSSSGIREAGIYGIPSIDVGSRQQGRYSDTYKNIIHVDEEVDSIIKAINEVDNHRFHEEVFGDGKSTERFMKIVSLQGFWNIEIQKHFVDFDTI